MMPVGVYKGSSILNDRFTDIIDFFTIFLFTIKHYYCVPENISSLIPKIHADFGATTPAEILFYNLLILVFLDAFD